MHITILGNVCIDKNTSENTSYTAAGGPAVFMQKIFSQLPEVRTIIISPYGSDFLPVASGLPLFPKTPTGGETLVYENVSRNGKREQKAYNREFAQPVEISQDVQSILLSTDILFFTPLLPNMSSEYVQHSTTYTKNKSLKVLLPQGYYRQFAKENTVAYRDFVEAPEILALIDIVIVSEQDGENMKAKVHEWVKTYDILGIVTLGEMGAIALTKDEEVMLPTTPVSHDEVVDSVGSGDVFSACFAYAYQKTRSIEKAGKFANRIARARLFFPADKITLAARDINL